MYGILACCAQHTAVNSDYIASLTKRKRLQKKKRLSLYLDGCDTCLAFRQAQVVAVEALGAQKLVQRPE